MSDLRRPAALLLPGCVLVDVPGRCAALPDAGGGVRERVFPKEVLLPVWLLLPGAGGRHLGGHRLPQLRDQESVRVNQSICGRRRGGRDPL